MQFNVEEQKHWNYLVAKREEVLKIITPMCKAFDIEKFDYYIGKEDFEELLVLNEVKIGCKATSYERIVAELVGYLFIHHYQYQQLGKFKAHIFGEVKRYWRNS